MQRIDVNEAGKRLPDLMEEAARGEEVVITRGDGAAFRLVPALDQAPQPRFGSAKGQVWMRSDFDEPLEGFEDYQPS